MSATAPPQPSEWVGERPVPGVGPSGPIPHRPELRSRRRPLLLGLGIALVCLGALTSGWVVTHVGHTEQVLVFARAVQSGQQLTEADFAVTELAHDASVATVPSSELRSLVGQRATGAFPARSLVAPESTSERLFPAKGESIVGLALKPGQFPAGAMAPGQSVRVVTTPGDQEDATAVKPGEVLNTKVVSVTFDQISGTTVVELRISTADAPLLAARAATGRIALLRESEER